ncbi:Collagen binding domain-containing protein [Pseudobutyrivibrio ruminis]|uniref:Collagen binding domain-containing protein n=1 Tax=Pseudobutyrivibrio ruminis TaxID=46206 RepID=A0A1H7F167_9FIRM|nr:SpaA isopeptide-forming pilin-related protein [Pseudobutyrivibrio ruminis]SEK19738.1 Collagen binding domain-containing protein [Pseudobutyrivibrio ruminis]
MKKRIMAAVLGFAIIFSTFSSDLVSQAEGIDEILEETVEEQTQLETPETEIITKEQEKEEVPINKEEEKEAEEPAVTEDVEQPETSVSTVTEETTPEEVVSEETEAEEVAFSQSRDADGVRISMTAAAGVLPKDSHFEAVAITGKSNISKIEDAVEKKLSDTKSVVEVKAFDITIYDVNGNEVQPDTSKGNVQVTFNNIDTAEVKADANKDMEVFHIADSMQSAESVDTSVGDGQVSFEAEHFSVYALVIDESSNTIVEDRTNANALISSIKLEKVAADGSTSEFKSGDSLSFNDKLKLTYVFASPITVVESRDVNLEGLPVAKKVIVASGEEYELPDLPAYLKSVNSEAISVPIAGKDYEFGKIQFQNGKTETVFSVSYNKGNGLDTAEDISKAEAGIFIQLNQEQIDNAENKNGVYELDFGKYGKYTIKVDEYKLKEPSIKTEGSLDTDDNGNWTGYVNWTVTLTNDTERPIPYDKYVFQGTIDENQVYRDGSLQLGGATVTPTSTTDLKWEYTGDGLSTPGNKLVYTYQTYVDTLGQVASTNVNARKTVTSAVTNKTNVTGNSQSTDYSNLDITSNVAKVNISTELDSWIQKTGTDIDSDGNTTWTVEIKNNGFTLKDLVLTDQITPDSLTNAKPVSINLTDVKVNGLDASEYSYTFQNNILKVCFNNSMSGNKTYTVTYKTQILNYDKYLKENHGIPSNSATISYTYDKNGTPVTPKTPTVSKPFFEENVTTYKASIEKTALEPDLVKHQMKWKIDVNKNQQLLSGVSVVDKIPDGHAYIGISDVKIDGKLIPESEYPEVKDANSGKEFYFGDKLNGHSASFVVTTELDNTQNNVWANNNKANYTNRVTLKSSENDDVEDSVSKEYVSKVLDIKADPYNYDDHTIKYTVTVDANGMSMDDVFVFDALDDKVEYVSASGIAKPTVVNNNIKFNVGTISAKNEFSFVVKVKDGDWLLKTGETKIENSAKLISNQYGSEEAGTYVVAKSNDVTINNKLLVKAGTQDTTNKENVDFVVQINPARQNLYAEVADNVVIKARDTMGSSLTLVEDSVCLYEATVNPTDGTLSSNTKVNLSENDISVYLNDDSKTVLEVNIPRNEGMAYVLKYTAKMLDSSQKDITNSIQLVGAESVKEKAQEWDYKSSSFGGADLTKYVYLQVKLVDQNDPTKPLAGAKIELKDKTTAKTIETAITNSKGEILFNGQGNLQPNTEYLIVETVIPEGYEISKTADTDLATGHTVKTVGTGVTAARNNVAANTVVNTKPSKTIKINLVDRDEKNVDLTKLESNKGVISITNNGNEVWNSSTSTTSFEAVYGQEYEVKEAQVPFGYAGDSKAGLKFKVEDDTTSANYGKLVIVENKINASNTESSITMYDHKLESVEVSINDVSDQGRYLSGAKFKLAYKTKDNVVQEWTSNGSFVTFTLPEGVYYLTRTDAPLGFINDESKAIEFAVEGDTVTFKDSSNVGDIQIIANENKVVVPETPDSSSAVTLTDFAPTKDGEPSDEIKTKIYTVTYEDGIPSGISDKPVWDSSDTDSNDPVLNPETEYVIVSTDSDGNSTSKVVMVQVYEDENGTIKTKLIEKPTLRGSDYVDVPVEYDENGDPLPITIKMDVKSPVVPTPAPSASENTGFTLQSGIANTASNNGSYTAKKDNQELALKEKDIIVCADLDEYNQDVNAPRLAKTGGFVGTLFGYITAVALILAGLYLTLGKKKEYDK